MTAALRSLSEVILVAANADGARTGNERTTQRIRRLLDAAGIDVHVARPDADPGDALCAASSGVVHGFHVRRSGPRALDLAARCGIPAAVSVTGTDLGLDLHDPERAEIVRSVLSRVDGVACGNEPEAEQVRSMVRPGVPVVVVPKSVTLAPDSAPARAALGVGPLVLAVAHVRRVKRLDVAILALRRLHVAERRVRLAILGDVLEEAEAARLRRLVGEAAWIDVFRGPVPPEDVPSWLAAADVVLNTSDVEGGSNAVLEAMAAGRPVVASDIPGNAPLVGRDGTRGLLYPVAPAGAGELRHNVAGCADAIARILDDPTEAARMGDAARTFVRSRHTEEAERDALLGLYDRALAFSRES